MVLSRELPEHGARLSLQQCALQALRQRLPICLLLRQLLRSSFCSQVARLQLALSLLAARLGLRRAWACQCPAPAAAQQLQ